ncbi:putative GTD-binding domain-containing protein [Lupinus albus]|uniref:Putative GTD-binding domain-containing protein n=1 Tax=Lupinus albus TaxID=3870 RepID=A0A6A4PIX0_LUPAL|nr:putative GTD-binding domain-containing protein [Lupinus albus]
MALYMELDEERSAVDVGANNAMATITRSQEEKATLQMDDLQLAYDEEARRISNDMVLKLEEEVKAS